MHSMRILNFVSAKFDPKKAVFGSLMVVVHAPAGDDVRIISVRNADPKERRNYEKGV